MFLFVFWIINPMFPDFKKFKNHWFNLFFEIP